MVWGGRREEGSGWGTHVYVWRIHVDIWQNQYNIVKLKKYILEKKRGIFIQQSVYGNEKKETTVIHNNMDQSQKHA